MHLKLVTSYQNLHLCLLLSAFSNLPSPLKSWWFWYLNGMPTWLERLLLWNPGDHCSNSTTSNEKCQIDPCRIAHTRITTGRSVNTASWCLPIKMQSLRHSNLQSDLLFPSLAFLWLIWLVLQAWMLQSVGIWPSRPWIPSIWGTQLSAFLCFHLFQNSNCIRTLALSIDSLKSEERCFQYVLCICWWIWKAVALKSKSHQFQQLWIVVCSPSAIFLLQDRGLVR